MLTKTIKLPELHYDRKVWIHGTAAERLEAKQQRKDLENCWKNILAANSLLALQFTNNIGQLCVLSLNPKHKNIWQFSHFSSRIEGEYSADMHSTYAFYSPTEKSGYDAHEISTLVKTLSSEATHGQIITITEQANN